MQFSIIYPIEYFDHGYIFLELPTQTNGYMLLAFFVKMLGIQFTTFDSQKYMYD